MENFLIPQALAQALLDYLAARPYREVHHFIDAMVRLQPADVQADGRQDNTESEAAA
ncbi:hypothetical protein Amn_31200 [Aminobacter sp. Y103A]|uniref:hypothetical protein n=1 Tax=Aminobacter sp. Y103A TaxID=1870862 RepID=UPI002573D9EF|nr:hypothetical protein [Aminobacter sp. SS-2016]BBD38240.1 hypothetical protein Amn_31200 [Aminobacter sp. SS-2016]